MSVPTQPARRRGRPNLTQKLALVDREMQEMAERHIDAVGDLNDVMSAIAGVLDNLAPLSEYRWRRELRDAA